MPESTESEPVRIAWFPFLKDLTGVIQSAFTIGAFVAATWWFYTQHFTHPQLKLEQTVSQRALAGSPDKVLLFLELRATNIGKVPVDLQNGSVEVFRENPQDELSLGSVPLGYRRLEPGESDQLLVQPLVVPRSVKTLQITANVPVPGSRELLQRNRHPLFWSLKTVVDIGTTESKTTEATVGTAK